MSIGRERFRFGLGFQSSWVVMLLLGIQSAMAASPALGTILPRGGQRGTEIDTVFHGARLGDAKGVVFYRPGLSIVKLEVANDNQVRVRLKIAADCPLGEHPVRVRTATGISELKTFYVGQYPNLVEVEPNNEFAKPQAVAFRATIEGIVEYEDVDYFAVQLKKGQRINVEIEGIRLGETLFDPSVTIYDSRRFVLAASDDSALLLRDGCAGTIAPADGTYIVEVREAAYQGNGGCRYRVHIGDFPRPMAVYPAGGKVGEELAVKFVGDVAGDFDQKIKLPDQPTLPYRHYAEQSGQFAPSANPLRVVEYPNVLEAEPNDDFGKAPSTDVRPPFAFNGIISKVGDFDHIKFVGKKGETFDFQVYGRRLRSPIDPVAHLLKANGQYLVGNDDSGGPDSYFRFTLPEDGEYVIQIHDHLRKGGPDYVYRCELEPVRAGLELTIPFVAPNSQERLVIPVPRGNRFTTLMLANRANFGGQVAITAPQLPPGVTLSAANVAENLNLTQLLFEAAADAPVGTTMLVDLVGQHADPNQKISGKYSQTVDLVVENQNVAPFWRCTVDKLAIAITDEAPFKVELVQPQVPLVKDGSMNLKVRVTRKPDFKNPVAVYFPFRPPGLGAASEIVIPADKTEGDYPINANGGAQVRVWDLCLLAQATVGNGPVWVSTNMIKLDLAEPFLSMAIDMAAVEQAKTTEVVCKLNQLKPFDGEATVTLVGLPAGVTTTPAKITKDAKEVVFKVATTKDSPAGQHKSLFCQVVITANNEPIFHNMGYGGTLRIDPPPPPKKDAPPAPAMPAQPAAQPTPPPAQPAPEKRLSRLEKLRLEQAEKAKTKAGGK